MFTVERRYLLKMTATGGALATYNVPWSSEEPVQALKCWIYSPDQNVTVSGGTPVSLGGGSAQAFVAGQAVGSATAFAGNLIVLPVTYTSGTPEDLHPQTTNQQNNSGKLQAVIYDDPVNGVEVDKSGSTFRSTVIAIPPVSTFVQVINTDSNPKNLIVHFIGLAWRNT